MMHIDDKAKYLYSNCAQLRSFEADDDLSIGSSVEAYEIQDKFIELKQEGGCGSIAGWKIALTNPAMQNLVGVNSPVEGAILDSLVSRNNGYVCEESYCHLGAEAEIALKVDVDIPVREEGFHSTEQLLPYFKEAMAAIEIVDDRNYGSNISFETLVAQNSMNNGCVIGEPVELDIRSLDQLHGDIFLSGKKFGSGSGKNVLQHPLNSVLHLINNLMRRGKTLRSEDIILTGSIATTCWPTGGDLVEVKIDQLGCVALHVSGRGDLNSNR